MLSTGTPAPAKYHVPERHSGPFRLVYTPVHACICYTYLVPGCDEHGLAGLFVRIGWSELSPWKGVIEVLGTDEGLVDDLSVHFQDRNQSAWIAILDPLRTLVPQPDEDDVIAETIDR